MKVHPEFPANQLALLESFNQWGDDAAFDRQMKPAERSFVEAQGKFVGPNWDQSWADWKQRMADMKGRSLSNKRGK